MKNNISNSTALAVIFSVSMTANMFLAAYVYLTGTDRLVPNFNGTSVIAAPGYTQAQNDGMDDFLTHISKRGR